MTLELRTRHAQDLVEKAVEIAQELGTDARGPVGISACCILIRREDMLPVPTALVRMDTAKAVSVPSAVNKAITALLHATDTITLQERQEGGTWTTADALLQQGVNEPTYLPWAGGIRIFNGDGEPLAALGIAGRSSLGDHRLAVLAAHACKYKTNFNDHGERAETTY